MIILVVILVLFGLTVQAALIKTNKRNILKKDYNALIIVLYLDALATIAFIFSVYFETHVIVKLIFEYITFLLMGIHFLIYMPVIQSTKNKRKWATFIIGMLGITILIVFHTYFDKTTTFIILALVLFSRLLLIDFKKVYASNSIKTIVFVLFATEVIRFMTEGFITADLIHHNFEDIWISSFSFIIRAMSTIFIINIHEQISINKNLAKTLDYQSSTVLLSQVFDQNPNVVVMTDMDRKIVYANPQATILTGYTERELIGQTPKVFGSNLTPNETFKALNKALSAGESWIGEFTNRKKNGEIFVELSKIMILKDINGVPVFYLAIKNDVTTEKDYLKALEYRSSHDDLTGLLRRQVFIQKFEQNILVKPELNHYFILMDIDEFKHINDSYGHLTGDSILVEFSNILNEVFNHKTYICRFGGDEFAVYLYDYEPEEVLSLIKALENKLLGHTINAISNDYRLKFSYGVTPIELPFDFSHIYEKCDQNLYLHKASKNSGKKKDK